MQHDVKYSPIKSASAPDPSVDARLARIENVVGKIAAHQGIALEDTPPAKSNKPLIAAAFGFAGLKLVGFTAGKFGFAADLVRAYGRNKVEGLEDVIKSFFNLGHAEKGANKNLTFMIAAGTIGAAVGTLGGAALGWARGDRLKSASELFTHPIDAMKKIFASKPPEAAQTTQQKLETTAPAVTTAPEAVDASRVIAPQHEGMVAASHEAHRAP